MNKNYSKEISSRIREVLREERFSFLCDETKGIFSFSANSSDKVKYVDLLVKVGETSYVVYALSPIKVDLKDSKIFASMTEFICRVNSCYENGCMDMDMVDGQVKFKVFVDCDGQIPVKSIVRNSIYNAICMFDCFGSGVSDVIHEGLTAEAAVEKCVKDTVSELCAILAELPEQGDTDFVRERDNFSNLSDKEIVESSEG